MRASHARLADARAALSALAGVVGVGVGRKSIAGRDLLLPALRVYVRHKLPRAQLTTEQLIPPRVAGLVTDVVPVPSAWPLVADERTLALVPGALVTNLRGRDEPADAPTLRLGLGTLCCLALVNRVRARELVLVANRHVLAAHGASAGAPIYMPAIERGSPSLVRRDSLEPVAELRHEGLEGHQRFAYRGEPAQELFIDCADARVLDPRRLGGARALPARLGRVHPLDIIGGRRVRVRKLGAVSGETRGEVIDAAATVLVNGERRAGNLLVCFADAVAAGDSGALIVDERDAAVAMLWGRGERDATLGYAAHLHPVLNRLDVTLLTRGFA